MAKSIARVVGALIAIAAFAAPIRPAGAQTAVVFAPDVTAELGLLQSSTVADEDIGYDDAALRVYRLPAFPSPANAELGGVAFDVAGGVWLVAFDVTSPLPGLPPGAAAEPRDVTAWDPGTLLFTQVFDGSAAGVPDGVRIDGLDLDPSGDLVLSFDVSTDLPGAGFVDDEDVVIASGGAFNLIFDGSSVGVAPELDVDALHYDPANAALWLSFDTTGQIGAVSFDDEDVVLFDIATNTFSLLADSSQSDPIGWPAADLVAVPEPGLGVGLVAGVVWLGVMGRGRRKEGARRKL